MDAFVLLGSFMLLMLIGMPVAFALGLAALVGALWINLPLDGVMIQIASGVNKFSLLAIPCFVLAGAIMAEGIEDQARIGHVFLARIHAEHPAEAELMQLRREPALVAGQVDRFQGRGQRVAEGVGDRRTHHRRTRRVDGIELATVVARHRAPGGQGERIEPGFGQRPGFGVGHHQSSDGRPSGRLRNGGFGPAGLRGPRSFCGPLPCGRGPRGAPYGLSPCGRGPRGAREGVLR